MELVRGVARQFLRRPCRASPYASLGTPRRGTPTLELPRKKASSSVSMRCARSAARTAGVACVSQKGKVLVGGVLQLVALPASTHSVGSARRRSAPVALSSAKACSGLSEEQGSSSSRAPATGYSAAAHMPRAKVGEDSCPVAEE